MNALLEHTLKQRINILCLGDFKSSFLNSLFPGIRKNIREIEDKIFVENSILVLIPFDSISKEFGIVEKEEVGGIITYFCFIKSILLNSVSISICREGIVDGLYKKIGKFCSVLNVRKSFIFESGNFRKDEHLKFFIDKMNYDFEKKGIDHAVVCVYGDNNNSSTDQGGSISDTVRQAVDYYHKYNINAYSISIADKYEVIEKWLRLFSFSKTNMINSTIDNLKQDIKSLKDNFSEFFEILKITVAEKYKNEGSGYEIVYYVMNHPLLKLERIEFLLPNNYVENWNGRFKNSQNRRDSISKLLTCIEENIKDILNKI